MICTECEGFGVYGKGICNNCDDWGYVEEPRTFDMRFVPDHQYDGAHENVEGIGHQVGQDEFGDILFTLSVKGDEVMEFEGKKMVLKEPVKISFEEAIFGKKGLQVKVYNEVCDFDIDQGF